MKALVLIVLTSSVFAQPPPGGGGVGGPPPGTPLQPLVAPVGNPSSLDKIMLGKVLYWDEQMSATKTIACASCHIPSSGGTDPRSGRFNSEALNPGSDGDFATVDDIIASPGVPQNDANGTYIYNETYGFKAQVTGRRAPSVINASFASELFWDGRAGEQLIDPLTNEVVLTSGAALESQVLGPPISPTEMGHAGRTWQDVIETLEKSAPMALSPLLTTEMQTWIGNQDYYQLFEQVFGTPEITATKIAMAIATYERSLFSDETPLNANLGGDQTALSTQQQRGLAVFRRARCGGCHVGPLLSDNQFHNIGLIPNAEDQGRFFVTGVTSDTGRFKTPPLTNLANRASFMHTGQFSTLEQVVDFYDRGGDFNNPNLDPRMVALNLRNIDKEDLVEFLRNGLTDVRVSNETGPFSRPQLYTESNNMPTVSGFGIQGTDNLTPTIACIEPPLLGNSNFTVTLENAKPAGTATLIIDTQDPQTLGIPTPTSTMIIKTVTTQEDNANSSTAHASINIALPHEEVLIGTSYYARWYIEDNQAISGLATSPLLEFTLFKPSYGQAGLVFRGSFEN